VRNNEVDKAVYHLWKATKLNPHSLELRLALASAILLLEYEKIDDPKIQEDLKEASEMVSEVLWEEPNNVEGLIVQGRILEKQGKGVEAASKYEKVISIDSKNSEAYFHLGQLFKR